MNTNLGLVGDDGGKECKHFAPVFILGHLVVTQLKKNYIGLSIVKQFICLDMGYLQINVGPGTLFKKYPQVLSFDIQRGCMNEYKKT